MPVTTGVRKQGCTYGGVEHEGIVRKRELDVLDAAEACGCKVAGCKPAARVAG